MLNLMGNLSLGNDNITKVEKDIFLQYLNLAHLELYQITANFNQDLPIRVSLEIPANTSSNDLKINPYLINVVWDTTRKNKLKHKSLSVLIENSPDMEVSGAAQYYTIQKTKIIFSPVSVTGFKISLYYVPQPEVLTIETDHIPYPLAYHPVLVDGALYYLFQEEGGFKNMQKSQGAQERWEIGKTRLLSYLYNSSGERLSTFSNV